MTTAYSSTVDTPIGPFTTLVNDHDVVLASGWTADLGDLLPQVQPSLRPTEVEAKAELGHITRAVRDYHAGELLVIDDIEVLQRSGEFREHAWHVLRTVPAGKPVTYRQYAELAGRPAAIRAAAGACAYNAATLFVPCHRVLRTDGSIGGFRWGAEIKQWLLDHEEVVGGLGVVPQKQTRLD
ncbi:methylated-DNA--[protein]-cysteine S-methyltransferase [Kutzneria sp. NPDC051319]|uniref:methylated-DNA--[protein]-cysteine S-methyltransferase n=1 Tax=Kutzneria sp. NPDC051319 TaxID=3155047 RepID=UPI00341E43A5